MKKAFSDLCVKSYTKISQVIRNRKGASTVEYVAVLAGAAAIAGILFSQAGSIGNELVGKVKEFIGNIGK
ncbi:hypothetical protein HMPREF9374_2752 [Desmospora sp. 8437]|nr:hypothetical protein HMPREF9374_2752 [Desmospora sp. 8437]